MGRVSLLSPLSNPPIPGANSTVTSPCLRPTHSPSNTSWLAQKLEHSWGMQHENTEKKRTDLDDYLTVPSLFVPSYSDSHFIQPHSCSPSRSNTHVSTLAFLKAHTYAQPCSRESLRFFAVNMTFCWEIVVWMRQCFARDESRTTFLAFFERVPASCQSR